MRIAVRAVGGEWQSVGEGRYDNEAQLRDLLHDSPGLVPAEEIDPDAPSLKTAIKEFGLPGSGRTDIVLLNELGDIWVVECKLANNPEVRRKVIGQVLEYAAYLWGKSYEEFDRVCCEQAEHPLVELVRTALDEEALADWSEEQFRASVAANLRDGRFRLVIAVDAINSQLKRTTEYLNAHPAAGFTLHALEMSLFTNEDTELLIPRLHGGVAVSEIERGRAKGRRWDRASFLQYLNEQDMPEAVAARVEQLLDWALECGDDGAAWGTGVVPAFTYKLTVDGKLASVFALWADGRLRLGQGQIGTLVESAAMATFVAALRKLNGFEDFAKDGMLTRPLSNVLASGDDASAFKDAVLQLQDAAREQASEGS